MQIFKFPLALTENQTVSMPAGSQALCINTQECEPKLWVLCDPAAPYVDYHILCVGTGHEIKKPVGAYLGSIHIYRAIPLVFHFFCSQDDSDLAMPLLSGVNPAAVGVPS